MIKQARVKTMVLRAGYRFMELVSDLKRLFSRRGKVVELHCDNATNFVGAKDDLLKIDAKNDEF